MFKYLCNYSKKRKYIHLVRKKTARQKKLQAYLRRSDSQPLDATGKPLSMADIDDELASIERQIAEHEEKIDTINRDGLQKITSSDLMLALKDLGSVHTKQEVEDMIWEVDEGLDGACEKLQSLLFHSLTCAVVVGIVTGTPAGTSVFARWPRSNLTTCLSVLLTGVVPGMVDWTEFMLMYDRNVNDKTGLEPCQLYDAVQFMMYDTDMSGTVSVDETMTMLYQRYGKKKLETELQRLFGNTLQAEDGIGELSFQQYVLGNNVCSVCVFLRRRD